MKLIFDVNFLGDKWGGLNSYTDTITIEVESGNPGGDPGEFTEFMRVILCEWFDGAGVNLRKEP